jgi:hypothetical protein
MGALRKCVNAGVRSSSTMNAHLFAKDPLKCALQVILDSIAMRLALPTGKRRAIVRNNQFQSSEHGDLVISER